MTEPTPPSASAVRRRQYLLLAAVAGIIVVAALLSVSLTGSRDSGERPTKAKSTNIHAPGSQVDPRDAWRGQADAQLKAIEQRSRELTQRNAELEGQNKNMMERLKKLEAGSFAALPPPPVAAPAARPNFGPDRPGPEPADGGPQRVPPPPPPRSGTGASFAFPVTPAPGIGPAAPSGIVTVTLADGVAPKTAKSGADGVKPATPARDSRGYIPSGAFTRAILLGGLDAPTGGQAQRNPQPVLLRLADNAVLPPRT